MMKKIISVLLGLCMLISLTACMGQETIDVPTVQDKAIIYDDKFGGFYVDISLEDFNAAGFELGDSVDISLSDGQELIDIPYYDGYYNKINETLICAYPGYEHIKVANNSGDDLYEVLNLNDKIRATVVLNTRGKYIDIQETMSTVYENDRASFDTDETFANYRAMTGGDLKEGLFYRSASPVDNTYNRAAYVDSLISKDGIGFILNLSDNEEEMQSYMDEADFNSPYVASLYQVGKIIFLDMSASYGAQDYRESVAQGLRAVLENDGPYLIHCLEGKDRTGFVAMLIEALCNADYEELLSDYMITYDNYYHINQTDKKKQYDAIVDIKFNDMVCFLAGVDSVEEIKNVDLQTKAAEYLMSGGMTENEIARLINRLT